MRYLTRSLWLAVLGLGLAFPLQARADAVKHGLFVLGIHLGGAEGVAVQFSGQPTAAHPGAIGLIKRNLQWSIDVADNMKIPAEGMRNLLANVDRLSFATMEAKFAETRLGYQALFATMYDPGAPAYFVEGIHEAGAEGVAVRVRAYPRGNKPGSGMLIQRNLKWMVDLAPILGLSTGDLVKLQDDTTRGTTFGDIATRLESLRLKWQEELIAMPGFGGAAAVAGTGPGTVVARLTGSLAKTDPFDRERKAMHAKAYNVNFQGGATYTLDLTSGNGLAGAGNPGYFDTWLRIEDASGKTLASDDDGGDGFNACVTFQPPSNGAYRLVVTSYAPGATGNFELTVRQK